MNIRLLTAPDVMNFLPSGDVVKDVLRDAFRGLNTGATVQPQQTVSVFPEKMGDCIFYPGVLFHKNVMGVKVSPFIVKRLQSGEYPVTAYTLLMSTETGEPILLCDSLALTTIRTAATTALALEYLIPKQAKTLAVIGSGKVARYHLQYVAEQHSWDTINIYSPSLADKGSEKYASRRATIDSLGLGVTLSPSAEEAVRNADVVMLCTSSGKPVVDYDWLKQDVVVTSISTNVPMAHEIDPETLHHYKVFCDYRQTAPKSAGEMVLATRDHGWSEEKIVGDLAELVSSEATQPVSGQVFFRSIGLGLEDLAIASLLI